MAIYKPEFVAQAEKLCKFLGATNAELAAFFGVTERCILKWMDEKPDFKEAVNAGKMLPDAEVAESLYWSAKGYEREEMDIKVVNGVIVETPYTRHYPPNPTSLIFYLCNRRKDLYRRNPVQDSHADIDRAIKELDKVRKELEVEALKKSSAEPAPVTKIEIEVVGANARASSQNTDD